MSTVAKKYILNAKFKGLPKKSDLKVVEESLPAIEDGGTLVAFMWRRQSYIDCTLIVPRRIPLV